MRPQFPEHALVTLLRQCFVKPRCHGAQARTLLRPAFRSLHISNGEGVRCFSSSVGYAKKHHSPAARGPAPAPASAPAKAQSPAPAPSFSKDSPHIAVLGGGITGLASAHYLTRLMPNANVTIYEGSNELGGWVKSKTVETDEGSVVFEQGPRSLRPNSPNALVTLDMIQNLGLESSILYTANDTDAALNRFVYYPDHLVKMPGPGQKFFDMIWMLMTEKIFKGAFNALLEYRQPPRSNKLEDESIGSWAERRFGGPHLPNNIMSAIIHGVYAGDVYKLSMRSLSPTMWYKEGHYGTLANAWIESAKNREDSMLLKDTTIQAELLSTINDTLRGHMKDASVYTFKGGLQTLPQTLEKSLRANPKVTFKMQHKICQLEYDDKAEQVKVTAQNTPPKSFTHCISTLAAHQLAATTPKLPTLKEIHHVTVMVVNLFYRDPFVIPEPGFGYLIPRSISFEQNPECALGVVYDSYSTVGQDTATGSKLTVMMGGHWWDGYDSYPTEAEGIAMASAVLKRHLKIDAVPERAVATLQRDCIPQYYVGHESRLKKTHQELMNGFGGRLSVAGSFVDGVGLNDCARNARDVVVKLAAGGDRPAMATGLEEFESPRVFTQVKRIMPVRVQPKKVSN